MKKHLYSIGMLVCILAVVFYSPKSAHSNQSGAPIGYSGSTGDGGATCTSCHGGGANPGISDQFSIFALDAPLEYEAGETYTFDVVAASVGPTTFGFQLMVEDEMGNSIGELILTDPINTQLIDGGNYITHTENGSMGVAAATWNFEWQAPSNYDGEVTMYAAGNIANGNGTTAGDIIMTSSLSLNIVDGGGSTSDIGCMNETASNYNPNAIADDGSCEFNIALVDEVIACGGVFLDSGGENGDYDDFENFSITIYPENENEYVSLTFNEFQLETCCDYLTIYDGESTSSPILQPGSNGSSLNGQVFYASPTNETGALTITFTSDVSVSYSGWNADIGCTTYGPCFGFEVDAIASFESEEGASDATAFLDITLGNEPFEYLWSTGETTESIEGLTAGTYSLTVTDSEGCVAEAQFNVIVDPEIYIMGEIMQVSTCNGLFYDSGGPDGNFSSNEDMFIRICPEEDGMAAQLDFTEFNLDWEVMTIYDGMGTSSPVLATGSFFDLQGETIVASEENSSGCLTVTFTTPAWSWTASGWEAYISCYHYIAYGCMDVDAYNYDDVAEEDDGSCYYAPGCADDGYVEYYTQGFEADYNDGSCEIPFVDDCMNEEALNYNPHASLNLGEDLCIYELDDWTCGMNYKDERDGYSYPTVLIGENCWMAENLTYAYSESNTVDIPGGVGTQFDEGFIYTGNDDYSHEENGRYYSWGAAQVAVPFAWHLPVAQEIEALFLEHTPIDHQEGGLSGFNAQMAGGLLMPTGELQFMNQGNTNWLWTATEEGEENAVAVTMIQGSTELTVAPMPKQFAISVRAIFGFPNGSILGCTDEDYIEYDEQANYDDGTCETLAIEGCTDETALNFNDIATIDDGSCIPNIQGCTDEEYAEYDETATVDDGSCENIAVFGCMDEAAQNFDENANVDDGSCIAHIPGCMDPEYAEYNEDATLDDGSCQTTAIFGCMDEEAFNYNNAANVDDGSCVPFIEGCTDENFVEYNGAANVDDGSCMTPVVFGCIIDYALNYNPLANTDDGSCEVEGCTNEAFVEYDPNANIDNGTCSVIAIWGCTDELYVEYFPPANMDDGSCENILVLGCTDVNYYEFDAQANVDDGSCENLLVVGCTDANYLEYNPDAMVDDNTCETPVVYGCMNEAYVQFNPDANTDNGSCIDLAIYGCTDPSYIEYNSSANVDDGSCTYIIMYGCTDENYLEYNPNANIDNGTCNTLVVLGCMDVLAFNYDSLANVDDGSCVAVVVGCMDPNFVEFNSFANTEDPSLCITPVVLGCTDDEAYNFNNAANTDDGSCVFHFVEITTVGYADGAIEFIPTILGLGDDYETYWTFGDGSTSYELAPTHFYTTNDTFEVTLIVNNGEIEVTTIVWVEVINAPLNIDELNANQKIVELQYFDLMGRKISEEALSRYQLYIQKVVYDDGSIKVSKLGSLLQN